VKLIPSIDLQAGRSRLVFWPGAATGSGAPTDRPERIARHFVELGAPMIHLVDIDGAQRGVPANVEAIGRVSREVAVPLQVAGGVDGPEQIELCFALGATRVVVPLWVVADSPELLRRCLDAAGDWLAVGVDGRPAKLAEYPWRSGVPPSFDALVGSLLDAGVGRLVVSHWSVDRLEQLVGIVRDRRAELQLAGGVTEPAVVDRLRDAGVDALIVGEALFNGTIDYSAAA